MVCGEVIGVYEPLLLLESEGLRETARAAERYEPGASGAVCFHRYCYPGSATASDEGGAR